MRNEKLALMRETGVTLWKLSEFRLGLMTRS